ncbi:MAG: hypothetical protein K6B65_07325 [Bacilli bacterium]|nr:hypothetical protein [Bacilli bacterium]
MKNKRNLAVMFATAAMAVAGTTACSNAGSSSGSIDSGWKYITFDSNTEVTKTGTFGRSFEMFKANRGGGDNDIEFWLQTFNNNIDGERTRYIPHKVGKCDGNDSFVFYEDLLKDESFEITFYVKNITRYSFEFYLSDNDDNNTCSVLWYTWQDSFFDRSMHRHVDGANAGDNKKVTWNRSEENPNYTYNYCQIVLNDVRGTPSFRIRNLTICHE